jgi:type IV pilus assembly protein PilO
VTNLQEGAPRNSPQLLRSLWLWGPIGAGALLAGLLLVLLPLPLWVRLQPENRRLEELEGMRQEVTMLRTQLRQLDGEEEKASAQNARLSNLITGSGDRSTFLAKLNQLATTSGVQLDLYEPQAEEKVLREDLEKAKAEKAKAEKAKAGTTGTAGLDAEEALPVDVPGLERYDILVSARGSYPALLTFLRRLEALNVLVAHSDLNLSLEEPKAADPRTPTPPPQVVLKLLVSLYGKPTAAAPG